MGGKGNLTASGDLLSKTSPARRFCFQSGRFRSFSPCPKARAVDFWQENIPNGCGCTPFGIRMNSWMWIRGRHCGNCRIFWHRRGCGATRGKSKSNGLSHQRARWFAMTWFFDSLTVGADAHIGPSRSAVEAGAERGDVGIAPYGVSGVVMTAPLFLWAAGCSKGSPP